MRNRKKVIKDSVPPSPPTNDALVDELASLKEELRKSKLLNEVLTV